MGAGEITLQGTSNITEDNIRVDTGESNLQGTRNIMEDNTRLGAGERSTLGTGNNIEDKNIRLRAGVGSTLDTYTFQAHKSQGEVDMDTNSFVDFDTLGLRRRLRSNKGKAPKRLVNTMMALAFVSFVTPISLATEIISH